MRMKPSGYVPDHSYFRHSGPKAKSDVAKQSHGTIVLSGTHCTAADVCADELRWFFIIVIGNWLCTLPYSCVKDPLKDALRPIRVMAGKSWQCLSLKCSPAMTENCSHGHNWRSHVLSLISKSWKSLTRFISSTARRWSWHGIIQRRMHVCCLDLKRLGHQDAFDSLGVCLPFRSLAVLGNLQYLCVFVFIHKHKASCCASYSYVCLCSCYAGSDISHNSSRKSLCWFIMCTCTHSFENLFITCCGFKSANIMHSR